VPFFRDFTVVTRDGQEVPIQSARDLHELKSSVFVLVRAHLLPLMLKKAQAGRMVEFGPLAVSSYALNCKGTTISWDEVARLVILTGSGNRHLTIYRNGAFALLPFCQFNLNKIPNDLLLLELLKQIAPPRLLVPNEARW
jgi:hypothetical protein